MKCCSCGAENSASSSFCAQCGAQLKEKLRCEACGRPLPAGAQFCPGCGYNLQRAAMILANETFEHRLYQQSRVAFYGRFVERAERKSAEASLYGVVRLLAKRPIELDLTASLGDLAGVLAEAAVPYVAALRRREVLSDLTTFLAGVSGEVQQQLARLDTASRAAAAELIDHPLSHAFGGGSAAGTALPSAHHIWPGIGVCIGPAIELNRLADKQTAEIELLDRLNLAFRDFVAAYDRLWVPLFGFVERYMAEKCHLIWRRLAGFELDFSRYAARIVECKNKAGDQLLDEALAAARLARVAGPYEPLAPMLEGHLLYRLTRREEALAAFDSAGALQLSFVGLNAERFFWSGRCLFDAGRHEEAIAAFETLVALPRQQIETRYFSEGEFLLAYAYLLVGNVERGCQRLLEAVKGGFTDVATLLDDAELAELRGQDPLRGTLRSCPFLQALGRQAGIHPRGSTYLSRKAPPLRNALAPGSWLDFSTAEEIVFFYDASRTGSGRSGLCMTDQRLMWKGAEGRTQIVPLGGLLALELGENGLLINGELAISDQVFDRLEPLHRLLQWVRPLFAE